MRHVWKVPADTDDESAEIGLMMWDSHCIRIEQSGFVITVTDQQLCALSDKLYFLSQIYQAEAQDALENLCCG